MKRTGWATTVSALAASAAIAGGAVGPASAEEVPTTDPPPDPEVVAQREASAMPVLPPGYDKPPAVQPAPTGATARMRDLYYLSAKQTTGGYIELAARDNPAQDKPGTLTTTMRIYGNAASFRSGPGDLGLRSQFTCTGTKVDGVTIGTSGFSVTGEHRVEDADLVEPPEHHERAAAVLHRGRPLPVQGQQRQPGEDHASRDRLRPLQVRRHPGGGLVLVHVVISRRRTRDRGGARPRRRGHHGRRRGRRRPGPPRAGTGRLRPARRRIRRGGGSSSRTSPSA